MVKAILFDFWGTLVENGVWSPVKQVKNILEIRLPFSEYITRMEKALMTSQSNNLKESFTNLTKEFNLEFNDDKLEQLIGMWNKSWMLAQPYEEIKETLQKLRGEYKLILVANTDQFSVPKVIEKFDLGELFDHVYLSYELGLLKTDTSFFKCVLTDLGLLAEDCVMVGDSIQSDIISAKRLGIKAILVDRRNSRDYHPKVKNLKELDGALQL
jgi:HAD superfamily hydrolase (TIGR01549 family)